MFCIENFGRAQNFNFHCSKFADVIEVILEISIDIFLFQISPYGLCHLWEIPGQMFTFYTHCRNLFPLICLISNSICFPFFHVCGFLGFFYLQLVF